MMTAVAKYSRAKERLRIIKKYTKNNKNSFICNKNEVLLINIIF